MSNKKIFKEMYSKEFDKEENYKKILEKMEERKKVNKVFKYAVAPVLALVLVIGGVFMIQNNSFNNFQNGRVEEQDNQPGDKIVINQRSNQDMSGSVKIDARIDADSEDVKEESIVNKFNLQNLKVPERYTFESSYALYIREGKETHNYNILHDYVLNYESDERYHINISISLVGSPIRDYRFDNTNDRESTINGTKLLISKYSNSYLVTYKKDNINYDIETSGITEEELITLLKSII